MQAVFPLLERNSKTIIAVFVVLWFSPFAEAQTEAEVALKIVREGGGILKDTEGNVESVILLANSDNDVERIDFSIFLRLKSVSIAGLGEVTDRSLKHLGKTSPRLSSLKLVRAQITDEGLARLLDKQKSLGMITLVDTTITDRSLAEIGELKDIHWLNLNGAKITDKGLKKLVKLRRLSSLDLRNTEVSDIGLREIKKMKMMSCLYLDGTKVTDAGIQILGVLEDLRWLGISSTKVTDNGKKALQQLLPDLQFAIPVAPK